jgi:hypothetical protein
VSASHPRWLCRHASRAPATQNLRLAPTCCSRCAFPREGRRCGGGKRNARFACRVQRLLGAHRAPDPCPRTASMPTRGTLAWRSPAHEGVCRSPACHGRCRRWHRHAPPLTTQGEPRVAVTVGLLAERVRHTQTGAHLLCSRRTLSQLRLIQRQPDPSDDRDGKAYAVALAGRSSAGARGAQRRRSPDVVCGSICCAASSRCHRFVRKS